MMEDFLPYLPYFYLAAVNILAVFVTLYDKAVSGIAAAVSPKGERKKGKKRPHLRVPEAFLLFLALIGGSPAMLLTMLLIRHKTKKAKFMVGIPLIIALQIAALWFVAK